MKEIAKEAKVSLGTVSNVLNGKSGVSLDKIEKVEAAIKKLGYQRNIQATQLKQNVNNKIVIILPNILEPKYSVFYDGFNQYCYHKNITVSLYLTYNQEDREREIIDKISYENYSLVITDTCLSSTEEYSKFIKKVIFIYRQPINYHIYINFNFGEIADDFLSKLFINNLSVVEDIENHFSIKDLEYFYKKAKEKGIAIARLKQDKDIYQFSFDIVNSHNTIEHLFVHSFESAKIIYNAFYFSNKNQPKIYTFYKNKFNNDPRFSFYGLDYNYIIRRVIDCIESNESIIKAKHFGFFNIQMSLKEKEEEITLLAPQTPSIDALRKLTPYFESLTGIKVNIKTCTFKQLPLLLEKNKKTLEYDLVRVDMESIPYFSEQYLLPLTFPEELLKEHFSESIIKHFSQFNSNIYAIPFDPSIQILFYRKDIFENTKIKRLFYEKYKKDLVLPQDFEAFNQLSEFFKYELPKEFAITDGTALIIGNEETIVTEFLMRYYAIHHSIFKGNTPQLDYMAAEIALKQLYQLSKSAKLLHQGWWKDSVHLFEKGAIPMLIVYLNHVPSLTLNKFSGVVGFTSVPKGRPLLGGGSLAIINNTKKPQACQKFLEWFLQNIIQEQYIQLGGISAKEDIIETQTVMQKLPWLAFAQECNFLGIRENRTSDNLAVDLRHIETIIDREVKRYLLSELDEKETINKINQALYELSY